MKVTPTLMIQGTTSNAGKSTIVTALCRILADAAVNVAPFKPQNMALNSAVSIDGGEIARAQAVQAQACRIPPQTDMNPILLKPNAKLGSQVIVDGESIGNMRADQYHELKPALLNRVIEAHQRLSKRHDYILVEGAGSPAEINLREHDIANMGFAEAINCPVILVVDIDRGGAFAHVVGTLALLSESERERVIGIIINRFRGDAALLKPGLDWLEHNINKPVIAVVPHLADFQLEAEDMLNPPQHTKPSALIKVRVPAYPRMSNHTDFEALQLHPQVDFAFLNHANEYDGADLLILPGSKSVAADFLWLAQNGWTEQIKRHLRYGGKLMGICGGFQMLGNKICDPKGIESEPCETKTFQFLEMETILTDHKTLLNVSGTFYNSKETVKGYEIHMGKTEGAALKTPLLALQEHVDGTRSEDNQIWGTYLHGLFDSPDAIAHILNWVRPEQYAHFDRAEQLEQAIQRLAAAVNTCISAEQLKALFQPINN